MRGSKKGLGSVSVRLRRARVPNRRDTEECTVTALNDDRGPWPQVRTRREPHRVSPSGRITLDGIDISDLKLADLRDQFSVVTQDPLLFSTTIAENIGYGRPNASFREIVEAAQAAQAHDFIMRLPQGYETPVGDRGARLSGGERQRIAIARAFLKDAPILILDEPTSAIDSETEALIVDGIERLMTGRTTFVIAHRLGTLRRADMVLRVESGRVLQMPHLLETAMAAA